MMGEQMALYFPKRVWIGFMLDRGTWQFNRWENFHQSTCIIHGCLVHGIVERTCKLGGGRGGEGQREGG